MSNSDATYAVIGATGQQGGAVVDALLERGAAVRGLTRDPESASARTLSDRGVSVVAADLDEPETLRAAFSDVEGVFAMTTFASARGTEGEVEHGKAIGDAAAAAGVPHLVYSSVGGAERNTGVPHFESKWQIEQYLGSLDLSLSVIRPTFFMDNFANYFGPTVEDGVCLVRAPLLPDVPLQMIAVSDIGRIAGVVLCDRPDLPGSAVEIAGDELTATQIAEIFGRHHGVAGRFESLPVSALGDEDQEAMFTWFQTLPAYTADFAATRELLSEISDFDDFVTALGDS